MSTKPTELRVSTLDLRAGLGELIDRVRLRFDELIIERKGKPVAALIPIARLRALEKLAKRHSDELEALQLQHLAGLDLTEAEVDRLVDEEVVAVRKAGRKRR